MKNHIYSTRAQIIEEMKICICDENDGTDDVLIKVMKNFTEHVQQCIASEKAHLYNPHATHKTPKYVK